MQDGDHKNLLCWHVYMLRCSDNTLYTGVTLNPEKRLDEHNTCNKKGAKYTRSRRPVVLAYLDSHLSKSQAYQREYQLKRLTKNHKEALVAQALEAQTHNTFTSIKGEE
jgi:putative endonuclease